MESSPDPFEEAGPIRSGGAAKGSAERDAEDVLGVREPFVQQAVNFLGDPRVKTADPQRAVHFLLSKNLTVAEIREAFRRAHLAFPGEPSAQTNVYMVPPGRQLAVHPPQRRSTWSSLFWGLTFAAGTVVAIRELLRRYVVPLYFPELIPLYDGRSHPGTARIGHQDSEIGELRATVQELVRSSRDTAERLDRLSMTMSSSGLLNAEISNSGDMTDSSRRVRLSVSASAGSNTSGDGSARSRGVLERLDELRVEVNNLKLLSGQRSKDGSLSYGGTSVGVREEFFTPRQDLNLGTNLTSASQSAVGDLIGSNQTRRSITFAKEDVAVGGRTSNSRAHTSHDTPQTDNQNPGPIPCARILRADDDDFMTLEPAQVEESWSAPKTYPAILANEARRDTGDTPEMNNSSDRREPKTDRGHHLTKDDSSASGKSADTQLTKSSLSEADLGFQTSMVEEADMGALSADSLDANGFVRRRPLSVASAPAPDTSLSDAEA